MTSKESWSMADSMVESDNRRYMATMSSGQLTDLCLKINREKSEVQLKLDAAEKEIERLEKILNPHDEHLPSVQDLQGSSGI